MLKINDVTRLYLGNQGENLAQTIEIDVHDWLVSHPNGTVSIWHKRNGDTEPYPTGAELDRDAGVIRWTPTNTDTYVAGEGKAEFRLIENNVIKKSCTVITGVSPSVTGAGQPLGSGWQDYLDAMERAVGMALAKKGSLKFAINSDGHLIMSYTDQVPIVDDEEEEEETTNE